MHEKPCLIPIFITLDKTSVQINIKYNIVATLYKHIAEALLMGTHNLCFSGEKRKIAIHFG